MMITGLLGIVMALGINYFVQSVTMLREIPGLANTVERYRLTVSALTRYLLPVRFCRISCSSFFSCKDQFFLPFTAVCIAVPAAVIGLLSGVYEKRSTGLTNSY